MTAAAAAGGGAAAAAAAAGGGAAAAAAAAAAAPAAPSASLAGKVVVESGLSFLALLKLHYKNFSVSENLPSSSSAIFLYFALKHLDYFEC